MQTQKKKEGLNVSDVVNYGKKSGKTASEVCYEMGINRRDMRRLTYEEMVHGEVGKFVINLQDGNGYFMPDLDTDEGIEDARRYISQERARAFALLKKVRRLEGEIAYITGENFWKSARLRKGLSRYEVIMATHIDSADLSKIENKRVEPTVEQEERLRKLYFGE